MVDNPPSQNNQGEKGKNEQTFPTALGIDYKYAQESESERHHSHHKLNPLPHIKGWWKDTKWTDKTIAIFTIVIAGAAILQWKEMRDAGTQTDRIIAADERIATAMENSVGTATGALNATIAQNQLDQRAWLGVTNVEPAQYRDANNRPLYLKEMENMKFGVQIGNFGKTPALNVKTMMDGIVLPKAEKFTPKYQPITSPFTSKTVIPPGAPYIMETSPPDKPIDAGNIELLKKGDYVVYIFGEIRYNDIFAPKTPEHVTTFCLLLVQSLDNLAPCDTYNTAN